MNIDSIKNGIVLDHIRAGRGMQIYNSLGLDQLDCSIHRRFQNWVMQRK